MKPEATPPAVTDANAQNAEQAGEQLDINQVKSLLNLPDTATDIELITVLVNLVANLQEKYESLLTDAVELEDKITNRDLADYADVIDEQSAEFWKDQIIKNRSVAIEALDGLRAKLTTEAEPQPEPQAEQPRTIPLRNRLAAIDRTVSNVAEATPTGNETVAIKIRNRAHEIAVADRVPFIIAFSRAERELTKE